MASVDFTLEDVKTAVTTIVEDTRTNIMKDVRVIVNESIDERFKVFGQKYDDHMTAIQSDFLRFNARFDRLESDVQHLKDEVHGLRSEVLQVKSEVQGVKSEVNKRNRLLDQHSKDIMKLRARSI
jgi:outer membrane murein-binding lipoprotein Lpp